MNMRKALIIFLTITTIISSACGKHPSPTLTPVELLNVEIVDSQARIYGQMSPDYNCIASCNTGDVFKIIKTGNDSKGEIWYQVQRFVDTIGWVEGKYCKKTSTPVNTQYQVIGKMFDPDIEKDVLLKLLKIDYSSFDGFIKIFGKDFKKTINDDGEIQQIEFTYPDGYTFYSIDNETVSSISYKGIQYISTDFKKIIANISPLPGNEIIYVINSSELLMVQEDANNVIGNYLFNSNSIGDAVALDFLKNGYAQLFISKQPHYSDESISRSFGGPLQIFSNYGPAKNGLYRLASDNSLVKIIDTDDFASYAKGIESKITDENFVLDIKIGEYEFKKTTKLPSYIFLNRKNYPDHSAALSKVIDWKIELVNGKYFFVVDLFVVFDALNAVWGLPDPENEDFGILLNDLSRTRLIIDFNNETLKIKTAETLIKYENQNITKNKLLDYDELKIQNGPQIGQDFDEACNTIKSKPKISFDGKNASFKGLKINKDWNDLKTVDEIYVENPKYINSRGIKVGDPQSKVIEAYGIPDQGFPGDEYAVYFLSYEYEGNILFTNTSGMTIKYKDKKVIFYRMYSYTMD